MELTEKVKKIIDSLRDDEFLFCYLNSPVDISKLSDETSQYVEKRFRKIVENVKIQ